MPLGMAYARLEFSMGFDLGIFKDPQLEADYVEWLVDEQPADIQMPLSRSSGGKVFICVLTKN